MSSALRTCGNGQFTVNYNLFGHDVSKISNYVIRLGMLNKPSCFDMNLNVWVATLPTSRSSRKALYYTFHTYTLMHALLKRNLILTITIKTRAYLPLCLVRI